MIPKKNRSSCSSATVGESIPTDARAPKKTAMRHFSRRRRFTINSMRSIRGRPCARAAWTVGLPDGQMGNSEVGHLNLGAGRIVYQDLTRINKAIAEGSCATIGSCSRRSQGSKWYGCIFSGSFRTVASTAIRSISSPLRTRRRKRRDRHYGPCNHRRTRYVAHRRRRISREWSTNSCRPAARDRHGRRTLFCHGPRQTLGANKIAWDAIVLGRGEVIADLSHAEALCKRIRKGRDGRISCQPLIFAAANEQRVRDGDVVIFFNFRADRARQLSQAFLLRISTGFDREVAPKVHYVTLTQYDKTYGCPVDLFAAIARHRSWARSLARAGLKQLRIAETEKYPHVTYFFNGGVEKRFPGRRPRKSFRRRRSADLRSQAGDERRGSDGKVVASPRPRTTW